MSYMYEYYAVILYITSLVLQRDTNDDILTLISFLYHFMRFYFVYNITLLCI